MADSVRDATRKELDADELRDRYARRLEELVAAKRERGEDVVEAPADVGGPREEQKIVDLMEALKASLEADVARSA